MSNIAIMMILLIVTFDLFIIKRVEEEHGIAVAIRTGIVMCVSLLLVILGNPWIWSAWTLLRSVQYIFFPGEITQRSRESSPYAIFVITTMLSVCFSAAIFVLFQYVR